MASRAGNAATLRPTAYRIGRKRMILPSMICAMAIWETGLGTLAHGGSKDNWWGWGVGDSGNIPGTQGHSLDWYVNTIYARIDHGETPFNKPGITGHSCTPVNVGDPYAAFYYGYWLNTNYHTATPGPKSESDAVVKQALDYGYKKVDAKVRKHMNAKYAWKTVKKGHLPHGGKGVPSKGGGKDNPKHKKKTENGKIIAKRVEKMLKNSVKPKLTLKGNVQNTPSVIYSSNFYIDQKTFNNEQKLKINPAFLKKIADEIKKMGKGDPKNHGKHGKGGKPGKGGGKGDDFYKWAWKYWKWCNKYRYYSEGATRTTFPQSIATDCSGFVNSAVWGWSHKKSPDSPKWGKHPAWPATGGEPQFIKEYGGFKYVGTAKHGKLKKGDIIIFDETHTAIANGANHLFDAFNPHYNFHTATWNSAWYGGLGTPALYRK